MKKIRLSVNLFLAFSLLLIAHASSGAEISPVTGEIAPTFVLRNWEGGYTRLRDFCDVKDSEFPEEQKRTVVLTFFSTICIPCKEELPALHKLAEEYKTKGVVFLLACIDKHPEETLPEFLQENKVSLPVLLDLYQVVFNDNFHLQTVPHTYVIDRNRKITASIGSETKEIETKLREAIEKTLK